MQEPEKPIPEREEKGRVRRLPYDYGAYDTPEVFERMFPRRDEGAGRAAE